MALDPERVGLDNIEVPQICDFGDNELDYLTRRGRYTEESEGNEDVTSEQRLVLGDDDDVDDDDDDEDDDDEDDGDDDAGEDKDDDEDDDDTGSTVPVLATESESKSFDYKGVLPKKFIDFLISWLLTSRRIECLAPFWFAGWIFPIVLKCLEMSWSVLKYLVLIWSLLT